PSASCVESRIAPCASSTTMATSDRLNCCTREPAACCCESAPPEPATPCEGDDPGGGEPDVGGGPWSWPGGNERTRMGGVIWSRRSAVFCTRNPSTWA